MKLSTFKKCAVFFLAMNVVALATEAQIRLGLKAGLNETEILTSNNQNVFVNGNAQGLRNFPRAAYNGGLLLSVPLTKKLSLQPELVFSAQGANGKPTQNYLESATEEYKFNFVNIPFLLKYDLPLGFFVETGPQLGILVSADIDESIVGTYTTNHYSVKDQYKSTDISWAFGAGYLSPFDIGFDLRYNLGLTDFSNVSATGMQSAPVQNGSIKNGVLQIGLFYMFGKSKNQPVKKDDL
jgi:hypothetical protein